MISLASERGFSLMELVTVVAIIGILAVIGMPMMLSALQAARVQAGAEEFATALNGARQLALTQNQSVCVTLAGGTLQYRPGTCADAPVSQVRLTTEMTVARESAQDVMFTYLGAAAPAATYTVTDPQDGRTLRVIVSTSGRVRVGS